ncbi:MAG: hypothetical protein ACREIA_21975 [Opitutaceae bacterium]
MQFPRQAVAFAAYYIAAFILSVAVELVIELCVLLGRDKRRVFRACILSNCLSYAVAAVLVYSWSFTLTE